MALSLVMRILIVLLLMCSFGAFAKGSDTVVEVITPLQVYQLFEEPKSTIGLFDLIDKEDKVNACVEDYIKKQSKSYAKIVQNNLYDLIHNFDRAASKIYGKKLQPDDIPYDEKIEALAKLQCEAYYAMKVLK